ncbi:VOC family protein [Halomarina pelagica]|uniref:VOC family protein n=1 Tax=Halomarina pelagica TaxID=2961599 RepID=UPI0020C1F2DF|nr:VOC family protein [Halomarina sp. BND7]
MDSVGRPSRMTYEPHHYGVTVSDIDAAEEFYGERLGLPVADRLSFDDEAFGRFVGVPDADVDIVFFDAGGFQIEVLEYANSSRNANEGVSNDDVGAAHVCLTVDDLDAEYRRLSDDVDFVSPPQTLENGATVAYALDPDGNVVELLET